MNKRTIQIDVIGPIEETELMKCKLYVDGRVCVIGMSRYDYEELMREKVFIRDGKSVDSAVSIRPRACFFPLFSFLPLWLHYNLNPLCVQY